MKEQILEEALGQSVDVKSWRKRMKEGFLVTLSIKRWRARKKLTLDELGIYPPDEQARKAYRELLTLGSKFLLPQETLNELEATERSARYHLAEHSFTTPFGTFIPYTSYKEWKWGLWRDPDTGMTIPGDMYYEKVGQWNDGRVWNYEREYNLPARPDHLVKQGNEYFRERFFDKRDEIVAMYDLLIEQLLQDYDSIARHTYQLAQEHLQSSFDNEEQFLYHYRTAIIGKDLKSASQFAASFVYDEQFNRIQFFDNLEADQEHVKEEEVETIITERQAEMEAAQKRRVMLEEMNRDLVAKTRQQKQALLDNLITSLASQVRAKTYEAITSVLYSIKTQETLQGRPVIQLRKLIDQIQNLNFYGDKDIDTIIVLLHEITEKSPKDRNIAEIEKQLRSIATLTRGTVMALGDEAPREGKDVTPQELGLALEPSGEEVREAREEITAAVTAIKIANTEGEREEREEREIQQNRVLVGVEEMRSERE